MISIRHLADRLALGALGLTALSTALVYRALPERVATHFDWHGQPDSWQPRALAAVMLPAMAVALWALLRFSLRRNVRGPAPWLAFATSGFLCSLHIFVLGYALRPGFDLLQATCIACGALFVALGLLLPRLAQNPWVGVRTFWTLRSPEVWARTQRVGGLTFFLGGVGIVVVSLCAPSFALPTLLGTLLAVTAISLIYSWQISRTLA